MPPVDLGQLPGQVAGALVARCRHERRADLAQVILEDRQRPRKPMRSQPLGDHRRRHLGVLTQQRGDLLVERRQLGRHRRPLVARRLGQPQQPIHGGAAHAEPDGDRLLAQPLDMVEAVDLGPVVHGIHPCSSSSTPGRLQASTVPSTQSGVQVSTVVRCSALGRRRHYDQVLRLPFDAPRWVALIFLGVLAADGPTWYVAFQGLLGVLQFAIGLAMVAGYRRAGVWEPSSWCGR